MAPFVIVRLILGAALTGAAALKSYQLATEPLAEGNLLSSRWFLIGVVECEFAVAAWLLTGVAPAALRRGAPIFFCALGGVALAKALAGEASCGCLGRWTISPWIAWRLTAEQSLRFAALRDAPRLSAPLVRVTGSLVGGRK